MTINLTPETANLLRDRAEREHLDISTLAESLLLEALSYEPDHLTDDEIAQIRGGIRRGLSDCEEGRVLSVDDWARSLREDLLTAHGQSTSPTEDPS